MRTVVGFFRRLLGDAICGADTWIADVTDWSILKSVSRLPKHYAVHLTYEPVPSLAALRRAFPAEGGVSPAYDGRRWARHPSCPESGERPGWRQFWLAEPPSGPCESREAVIVWAGRIGYRPATHQEAIEFALAHPGPQRRCWIIALGSSTVCDGEEVVAVLGGDRAGRSIVALSPKSRWDRDSDCRLLLVAS